MLRPSPTHFLAAFLLFANLSLPAQSPPRPKIIGISHIALFAQDIAKSRAFYNGLLGYEEVFHLDKPDGSLDLTFFKVNENQYIEIFMERAPGTDRLNHISLQVENAEAMRAYLGSHGIKVPEKVSKGRTRNSNFNIKDADGHTVEIVQYEPDGWTRRDAGKALGANRISTRMPHVGILVGALDAALAFYRDLLGFTETWRGSRDSKQLSWVNVKLPDSRDYVEFMLYEQLPVPNARGTQHHICLEVPDIEKALAHLQKQPGRAAYTRPLEIRTGINRKRQLNLYDPDGTRIELMEPDTVDGKPVPPSPAPPPR